MSERERIAAAYQGYLDDPRKRRAWDAANPGNAAIRDEVAAAILTAARPEIDGGGALLDAGCGSGWWLARLLAHGAAASRLHGVELLEERALRAAAGAPGATVVTGDVRALPYPDAAFAAVFLLTVLSSVRDRERAIAEAWRVIAPRGVLVVWEPRVPNPFNRRTWRLDKRELTAATEVRPQGRSLTLMPWLSRRLGRRTATWYPKLAALPFLRTHRLYVLRRTGY